MSSLLIQKWLCIPFFCIRLWSKDCENGCSEADVESLRGDRAFLLAHTHTQTHTPIYMYFLYSIFCQQMNRKIWTYTTEKYCDVFKVNIGTCTYHCRYNGHWFVGLLHCCSSMKNFWILSALFCANVWIHFGWACICSKEGMGWLERVWKKCEDCVEKVWKQMCCLKQRFLFIVCMHFRKSMQLHAVNWWTEEQVLVYFAWLWDYLLMNIIY